MYVLLFGFCKQDIVVLLYCGCEGLVFVLFDQFGLYWIKCFIGKYDLFGNFEYCDGDVLFDLIYCFKGQLVLCVIFIEVDFDMFDVCVVCKLFVGVMCVMMKLLIVVLLCVAV